MKSKLLGILLCVCFVLVMAGCEKQEDDNLTENTNLNTEEKVRYVIMKDEDGDEYKIYYYGIDYAFITVGNNTYDFEQAILTGALTLDEILDDMELDATLNDGGTKIYRDSGSKKYFNDSYSIIRCNTIDGNRDIYIGKNNMEYEDGFCKFKITDAEIKLQEEVDKMKSVKKIIVKNTYNNNIINTITDEDKIKDIINMISNSTESTLVVTSDGTNLVIKMFDNDDKLITSIYVWESGYFGFKYDKEYFVSEYDDIKVFKDMMKIK